MQATIDRGSVGDGQINTDICSPRSCTNYDEDGEVRSCGTVPNGCGHPMDCGACPIPKVCSGGKCVGSFLQLPEPQLQNPSPEMIMSDPTILDSKPLLKVLGNQMLTYMKQGNWVSDHKVPMELAAITPIFAWISSQGWTDVGKAFDSSGHLPELTVCLAMPHSTPAEVAARNACSLGVDALLVEWAVDKYVEDAANAAADLLKQQQEAAAKAAADAAAIDAKAKTDSAEQTQQDQQNTPAPSSSCWTIAALTAGLLVVGGVGYYTWSKSKSKKPSSNPAKISGYKKLNAAIKHAYRLAVVEERDHYVYPRSDGFYLDTATPSFKDNEEYIRVTPNGDVEKYVRGRVGWNMQKRLNVKRVSG